jgi:hypothetical protein
LEYPALIERLTGSLETRVAILEKVVSDHISSCVWWQRAIFSGIVLLIAESTARYIFH